MRARATAAAAAVGAGPCAAAARCTRCMVMHIHLSSQVSTHSPSSAASRHGPLSPPAPPSPTPSPSTLLATILRKTYSITLRDPSSKRRCPWISAWCVCRRCTWRRARSPTCARATGPQVSPSAASRSVVAHEAREHQLVATVEQPHTSEVGWPGPSRMLAC